MWDWIIAVVIILALILVIWARVTKQTMGELLRDIKDLITDSREEVSDRITYDYYDK